MGFFKTIINKAHDILNETQEEKPTRSANCTYCGGSCKGKCIGTCVMRCVENCEDTCVGNGVLHS